MTETAHYAGNTTLELTKVKIDLLLVFFILISVYFFTSSVTVGLEDDGLFILSSYYAGISHPPGYPLFTILGHVFSTLPFDSIAFRVHMTSAFFGALTGCAIFVCAITLMPSKVIGYLVALAYCLSETFWSQSIVAEVYTLNTFLVFLLIAIFLRIGLRPPPGESMGKVLSIAALTFGLGLANHWPLVVLTSPGLLILAWPYKSDLFRKLPLLLTMIFIGLLPYGWMVWRSWSDPFISFYGPINNFGEFWHVISRAGYKNVDSSQTAGIFDKVQFSSLFIRNLLFVLTPVGFIFSATGFVRQWREWGTRISLALTVAFVCSSFVLIALLGFDFDKLHKAAFQVYPLVSYGILAIWMGLGLFQIARKVSGISGNGTARAAEVLSMVTVVGILIWSGLQSNNRRDFSYAKDYAATVLDLLPMNAVLFANDEAGFGAISYHHFLENRRPDISIYQIDGLALSNRIFDPLNTPKHEKTRILFNFIDQSDVPVYFLGSALPATGIKNFGLFSSFSHDLYSPPVSVFEEGIFEGYEQLMVKEYVPNAWLDIHRAHLSSRIGWVLGTSLTDNPIAKQKTEKFVALDNQYPEGFLGLAMGLVANPSNEDSQKLLLEILLQIEHSLDRNSSDKFFARYLYVSGIYLLREKRYEEAVERFSSSVKTWNHTDNPSASVLNSMTKANASD